MVARALQPDAYRPASVQQYSRGQILAVWLVSSLALPVFDAVIPGGPGRSGRSWD
jgi:hypothetical protein